MVTGLALATFLAFTPTVGLAQVQNAYYQAGARGANQAERHANFNQDRSGNWMNAQGESVVVPASYRGPGGGGASFGSEAGCNICGGGGCPCCTAGSGPYPPGGPFGNSQPYGGYCEEASCAPCLTDQCGPHYFDFSTEALYWKKDSAGDPDVAFVKEGINGPTVIGTNALDFENELGIRLIGRYDVGALSFIEATYSGLFEWGSAVQVSDNNGIFFTPFSNFGVGFDTTGDNNPDQGVGGAGLDSTEAATFARVAYRSELHNAEFSFRRYWVGYSPRITGTLLAGFRYTRLNEGLVFDTTATGSAHFDTQTENDLTGFQAGGDVWVTIRQGIRLGAEGKVGLYNNRMESSADITSTDLAGPLHEVVKANHAAFIAEGGANVVFDILPRVSIKGGYDVLFINTVALASNNFNFDNAPFLGGNRTPFLVEESSALYHGYHVGLECIW